MKITKSYDENVNLGNYQTARVGITISSDIEITGKEGLREASAKLLEMAKTIVREELQLLKNERGVH